MSRSTTARAHLVAFPAYTLGRLGTQARARLAAVAAAAAAAANGCAGDTGARTRSTSAEVAATSAYAAPPARSVVEVPFRTRFAIAFDVPARTVAPDDVRIEARLSAPSGAVLTTGGFASHGRYHVRFTPREVGLHRYVVHADGGAGSREVARGEVMATRGGAGGFVGLDPKDHHRLLREDGEPVYVLGENRVDRFGELDSQAYLARMASFGMRTVRVLVSSDCASQVAQPGYPIGCLEPAHGRFDERTADALDALFDGAERSGIDVVLVAFANASAPRPEAWFTSSVARAHAARRLRYVADRWGASPRLLAIDLLNEPERDGAIPEATWLPWAEAMSEAWRSADPYRHLVTTGASQRPWYASARNDLVQWSLRGKELRSPHALALETSRKVGETYGFGKPVVCGELASGGEDGTTYDHTHDGIWSLLFSGAGALSDEPMTPERGAHFKVLSDFLRSFGVAPLSPAHDVRVSRGKARAWSLVTPDALGRGIWVLGDAAGYGKAVGGAEIAVPAPPAGRYVVTWSDDTTGAVLASAPVGSPGTGEVRMAVPTFTRHVVGRLSRDVPSAEHGP